MTILTATAWKTNAHLIKDVAKLGYLDGSVLDVTYGYGVFWQLFKPDDFTACDLDPAKSPLGYSVDFTNLKGIFDRSSFDTVVLDPPYKLNGMPTEEVDERYGVHEVATWRDRYSLINRGILECSLYTRHYLLLKCMDQVVSGKKRWQTIDFTATARACGMELEDRFDMLVNPRQQPGGRRQVHAQGNYSTLLVFSK